MNLEKPVICCGSNMIFYIRVPRVDFECSLILAWWLLLTWTPIISSLRVCWPLFPWKGMWLMLENLEPVQDVKWYFLSAPWLSLHWHSLVVGLEALRIIRFDQVLFPWSVFPGSKKMIAEANVPHVVMKYITCVGISYVILLRRSPRSHPSLCCVPPRSSARLPSE